MNFQRLLVSDDGLAAEHAIEESHILVGEGGVGDAT